MAFAQKARPTSRRVSLGSPKCFVLSATRPPLSCATGGAALASAALPAAAAASTALVGSNEAFGTFVNSTTIRTTIAVTTTTASVLMITAFLGANSTPRSEAAKLATIVGAFTAKSKIDLSH
jgi:hypothetical protein